MLATNSPKVREIIEAGLRRKEAKKEPRTVGTVNGVIKRPPIRERMDKAIKRNQNLNYLDTVLSSDSWEDQPCFILGGGPSLNKVDLSCLDGRLSIGVNRAFELYDPSLNFSIDIRFLRWLLEGCLPGEENALGKYITTLCTKVWSREMAVYDSNFDAQPIYLIDHNPDKGLTYRLSDGLCMGQGNNSGFTALNLACCLGANPIYLLGFDMIPTEEGLQQNWHKGYPITQNVKTRVYPNFIEIFNQYADSLESSRKHVINVNPESAIECFPKMDQKDLNALKKPVRPLVVAYHTPEDLYCEHAEAMKASAHRFGLRVHLEPIQQLGGWQKSTYYKARFLKSMLEKFPDEKNLLYVDVDARFFRYPTLFDNHEKPFGVSRIDWTQIENRHRNDSEVNSSIIYFRNEPAVMRLLDAWISRNYDMRDSGVWEQMNLEYLLKPRSEDFVEYYPNEYCQIHDLMSCVERPVIQLLQASRVAKGLVGR